MSTFAPSTPKVPTPRVHHSLVPHWIVQLGPLGLFLVAVVDASIVPLPIPGSTDLLLLLLVSHQANPWLYATTAIAGSILGGYTTWRLGKRGGEAALHRWVSVRLRARIVDGVERHPVLAVFLPAVLPPPIPLSPFILASGALGVSRGRFLIVFATARSLRYGLIAWLAVAYGRHVVRLWNALLQKWSTPLLWAFSAVLVAAVAYAIWKLRRPAKSPAVGAAAIKTRSAQAN
jgi:membrane protein YqaA with SNARE-associated domain